VSFEGVRQPVDEFCARTDVHAAPRLALESGARALHGAIDVGGGRIGNARDHVAGCRIADVEHLAIARFDLGPVDEIAMDLDVDGFGWNIHGIHPSTMTALRFNAGSTRFSVAPMCALIRRAAVRRSRFCIASISAICSATSFFGSCPLRLVTLTRTSR